MKNINNIKSLLELLEKLKNLTKPVWVGLSCREGSSNYFMDQIVTKVQPIEGEKIAYQKLDCMTSQLLKEELMITDNPVLLLINKGEIKAIFSGMVGRFQLEDALQNLNSI